MLVQAMPYPIVAGPTPSIFTTEQLTPKWLADGSPASVIVPEGTGGDWDLFIREIGNVIDEGTPGAQRYKLTYTGHNDASYDNTTTTHIGWAYSSDGSSWTKGGELITARSLEDPWLIKVGGTYYLYVEDKADTPFRNIRCYTSTDFSTWNDEGDILDIGTAGSWEDQDVSSPVVWREGSSWKMLYEGRKSGGQQGAVGLATSSDGLAWTKDPSNPVFEGGDFSWNTAVVPDDIMVADDGTYVLLYHGLVGSFFRSAVAHSADLYSWTDPLNNRSIRLDTTADSFTAQFHPVGSSMHFISNRDLGPGIRQGDDMGYETLVVNFTGANGSTSFTDESAWAHTLTANGNAQIQSNKLLLDGTGDYVSSADSEHWYLGSVDFTIEAFGVEFDTAASNEPIIAQYTTVSSQRGWLLSYNGGQLRFHASSDGIALTTIVGHTWAPSVDTPYDIAIERSGSTFRLYIDGVNVADGTDAMTIFNSTEILAIGRQGAASPSFADIRMKAARITNGRALYATDGSYTVPSLPI